MVALSSLSEIVAGKFAAKRTGSLRDGERWYAVHTLPFGEKRAAAQLENQDFCTFLPKRQKTIRHARKLSTITAPFFPRYLFVALDLHRHRWRSVNGTLGVSSLVMVGERPCPAPHGIVESLLAAADAEGMLQLHSGLTVGAPVRLAAGPFADQLGILDRLDDAGRVRVLLSMFGQQVPVCLSRAHVLPAG
jgi:transcription elongation factor/antiterminator RfaH